MKLGTEGGLSRHKVNSILNVLFNSQITHQPYSTYEVKPLTDLSQFLSGFPQVAKATLDRETDFSRYVPAVGLRALTKEGDIDWSQLDQVRPPHQLRPEHRLATGDVIISARGSGVKIGMVRNLPPYQVYSTTNVIVVRPISGLADPTYLWACLNWHRNDPREEFFSRGSTAQWSITLRELGRLPIHLPPMAEQVRIASAIVAIQSAAEAARAVAAQYDLTLDTLIRRVFAQAKPL